MGVGGAAVIWALDIKRGVIETFEPAVLTRGDVQVMIRLEPDLRPGGSRGIFSLVYAEPCFLKVWVIAPQGSFSDIGSVAMTFSLAGNGEQVIPPQAWNLSQGHAAPSRIDGEGMVSAAAMTDSLALDFGEVALRGEIELCDSSSCIPVSIDVDLKPAPDVHWKSLFMERIMSV